MVRMNQKPNQRRRTKKQKKKVNNHVLEDFKEDEEEKINEITENIVKQLPTLIEKKIDLLIKCCLPVKK